MGSFALFFLFAIALFGFGVLTLPSPARSGRDLAYAADIASGATSQSTPLTAPHQHGGAAEPSQHEASEGIVLAPAADHSATLPAARCTTGVRTRSYDVAAINVDITYDRYLDHDPEGRMYVLETDLERVRREETQNARARDGVGEPGVSIGLQGDAIQPLTLRVNQGECLRIRLRNALADSSPVGLHIHGAGQYVVGSVTPATDGNADAYATPNREVTYEWMVPLAEPDGTHYFHGLGDERFATGHGLFGAVIVEPTESVHRDPLNGAELRSGWQAVIVTADGRSFREAVLYYHEVGDELYQLRDGRGGLVPLVDPLTSAYRPAARALNYRSEPFLNRLSLQESLTGNFDESVAYSSYSFGDPATPMIRSYLGDPLKQRVVHGGSEVFHVHHVHGGAIRWRRQPGVEPVGAAGLDKHPPLTPIATERVDAQSIGPSETFDLESECGSGGCQQSAGDYLVHCHVAHHYFAGMWTLWRVYNTLQDGVASTDGLPPFAELPDLRGRVAAAVSASALVGRTVDWYGKRFPIDAAGLDEWVSRQLPPPGVPNGYDASVWDWRRLGDRYLGEVEDARSWPGYRSAAPGSRPELRFDPYTGKLAYPLFRPHLGKRPPFAPGHGPAPYLDPISDGVDPPAPGVNGPGSVCPAGTRVKSFAINAIRVPVVLNSRAGLTDPAGELYVLREDEDRTRADPDARTPLAIRANAGEDCVDLTLRSDIEDSPDVRGISKVDVHVHFVQFDVQASDGVVAGFNYEQSVRPYRAEGERVRGTATAGATRIDLAGVARFQAGVLVGVGMEQDSAFEIARVREIEENTLVLDRPLRFGHGEGEIVSTEFVRYRWYPDVQFGTAYFHDHVNAIDSWRHGLFGALIAEPPGSTYHDPRNGAELRSGTIADIHTSAKVSADLTGSFRELAMFIQDDNPITHVGRSSGSSFNLRAEPLEARGGDPSELFSSARNGDPATPVLDAYLGDPVVVRLLVAGTNDVHTWHVDGHTFRTEPFSPLSAPTSTVHLGISERYDITIPAAGGVQRMPGDYLYYSGRALKLVEGSWGILRVRDPADTTGLRPLPARAPPRPAESVCAPGAPERRFAVAAVEVPLPMLSVERGRVFVLASDEAALMGGQRAAEPLVLHVSVGDCVRIELANHLPSSAVSFHADMLAFDPRDSAGVSAGRNAPQVVAPGASRVYTFFAHPTIGETTALVRDFADVARNPRLGLYGAIVVGPVGATYTDPETGADISTRSSWRVDVHPPDAPAYRDFALFFEDEDAGIGTHRMPYTKVVDGVVGLNYRSAPLAERSGNGAALFDATRAPPRTPLLEALVGDAVHIHVLAPYSEQAQVFTVEGHRWPFEPGRQGTSMLSSAQVGGLEAITVMLDAGAGGGASLPGDFLYGDHRTPYRDAGLWGVFRVYRCLPEGVRLRSLTGADAGCGTDLGVMLVVAGAVVMLGLLAGATLALRARRARLKEASIVG
ncbi:MAG TPA: multicopper oxidase domain-containing protein [Candidatus Limnocylindria bacterium]|nr:multicopper oxidase domain-containing protein [Candidatus Limnocylindria bacterium]